MHRQGLGHSDCQYCSVAHARKKPPTLSISNCNRKALTVVDSFVSGFRSGIQQDTDLGVQHATYGVEEPSMRVDLFRVFLLEDKDDLNGNQVVGISWVGLNELGCSVNGKLSGVLVVRSARR
jgi:hypothetical protein